jgi:heme exporter protein A
LVFVYEALSPQRVILMTWTLKVSDLALKKGHRLLIDKLNFTLYSGQALSLNGPNGVGKTTVLRTIAQFLPPYTGQISLISDSHKTKEPLNLADLVHYLGHNDAFHPARTARQELEFQAAYMGSSSISLAPVIGQLKLSALLNLPTRYLSAGQRRRLSCARLLSVKRPLWLLDEPMAPLDEQFRETLARMMQDHLDDGGLLICAVHDPLPFATQTLGLERAKPEVSAHVS